jgi:hypothetical protein
LPWIDAFQPVESLVHGEEQLRRLLPGAEVDSLDAHPDAQAAVLHGAVPARPLDEDLAHGAGGGAEEVARAVPPRGAIPDQAQVGLVDERCGLQGLAGLLPRHLPPRKPPQLLVEDGEKLLGGPWISGAAWFQAAGTLHVVRRGHVISQP